MVEYVVEELRSTFPSLAEPLIFERDTYMAEVAAACPGPVVVAVVGMGHARGMRDRLVALQTEQPERVFSVARAATALETLQSVPPHTMTLKRFALLAGIIGVVLSAVFYYVVSIQLPALGIPASLSMLWMCVMLLLRSSLFSSTARQLEQMEAKMRARSSTGGKDAAGTLDER
jgi:pheromone shutdown protein TraB